MFFRKLAPFVGAVLIAAPSAADAEWLKANTRHFIIYTDDTRQGLQDYAERLEKFDNAVRQLRGMKDRPLPDSAKVTIYVVPGTNEIVELSGMGGAGGFYQGRASGSVAFVPKRIGTGSGSKFEFTPDVVFFHEYSHHLQLQDGRVALPAWMVEGFAEFYGTAKFRPDGSLVIGAPANFRSDALYHDDLPLDAMLTGSRDIETRSPLLFYGKAWLLTHYLAFSKEREGQLTRYIQAIQSGQDALQAAKSAFGDLKKLDGELFKYMRGSMSQMVIPASAIAAGKIEIRALTPGEASVMKVRARSEAGVSKDIAGRVAAEARRAAAAYPNDVFAQGELAEAEFDAKNYDAAIAATQRALAVDPRDLQALVYRGRALMAKARKDKANADWNEVRRWFKDASRVDPEAPEPLVLLYQSYKSQGIAPTALAVNGLIAAQAAAPQDESLRRTVVRQLIDSGRFAEAERLFAATAYNPHLRGKGKERADKVMAAIKAHDAKAAQAVFEEALAEARKRSGVSPEDEDY